MRYSEITSNKVTTVRFKAMIARTRQEEFQLGVKKKTFKSNCET